MCEPGERDRFVQLMAKEVAEIIAGLESVLGGNDAMIRKSHLMNAFALYFGPVGVDYLKFMDACRGRSAEEWP